MTRRKFTIADGMILVAALAVGLALSRAHLADYHARALYQSTLFYYAPDVFFSLPSHTQVTAVVPVLAVCSLAVLILHWLKPRITRRRLVRRPGSAACLAVVFGLVISVALNGREIVRYLTASTPSPFGLRLSTFDNGMNQVVGISICASWAALAFGGRWTWRAADWRGQLGQILGWAWLLLFILLDFNLGIFLGIFRLH